MKTEIKISSKQFMEEQLSTKQKQDTLTANYHCLLLLGDLLTLSDSLLFSGLFTLRGRFLRVS